MPAHPTRLALVLVALLLSTSALAQVAVAMALTELNNVGAELQTTITNNMAAAINERNHAKLMDAHVKQMRLTRELEEGYNKLVGDIDRELAGFESGRGKDPAAWGTDSDSVKAKARYGELKGQREQVVQTRDTKLPPLKESQKAFFKVLRSISGEEMDEYGQELITRQKALAQHAAAVQAGLAGIKAQQQATASVKPIKLKNDAKDVTFFVNDVRVAPKGGTAQIAMPADRVLRIRAEATTEQRTFNLTKAPTKNASIDQRTPYVFQFTVDTGGAGGQTTWQVTKEEYEWSFPGNPKLPSTHAVVSSGVFGAVKNDVFVWTVPQFFESRFGKGWYESFWIATRGSVDWSYERRGMGGVGSKSDKKTERFDGSGLDVKVGAE